ncbi:MAG: hypothetical protein R6U44_07905 [Archaeoglobaceae archaeon]
MLSELLALMNGSNSRPLFLIFMPATITGMFLLPNLSLFFMEDDTTLSETSVSDEELELSCSECHDNYHDIAAEIESSPVHTDYNCTICHKQGSDTECEDNRTTVRCSECHNVNINNFSAHRGFMEDAEEDPTMNSTNEACIGCHTHASVRVNWTHRAAIEFEVVMLEEPADSERFDVAEWNYTGTVNYTAWKDRNNKSLNFTANLAT